jgi:hypothetical protein
VPLRERPFHPEHRPFHLKLEETNNHDVNTLDCFKQYRNAQSNTPGLCFYGQLTDVSLISFKLERRVNVT